MATIQARIYIDMAQRGQPLTTEQRRHAIAYLMTLSPSDDDAETKGLPTTVAEMAALFGVHDRTVQNDKVAIRTKIAEEIKSEDIALVIADMEQTFMKVVRNIEKSAAKAKLGTDVYLKHQLALAKVHSDYVANMQSLGIYPKELGTIHEDKFEFSAQVGMELLAVSRPVKMFDGPNAAKLLAAELVSPKELNDGKDSSETEHGAEATAEYIEPDPDQAGVADSSAGAQLPTIQAN